MYMNLKEIVEPNHTALLVWDVQNLLVNGIFNKKEFLKDLKSLIEIARVKNIPIIYSKITPLPKDYESSFRTFMFMKRFKIKDPEKLPRFLVPGTPEAEIPSEVAPSDTDIIIEKNTASIFIGTNFEYLMRNKGIDTILFTGISTEFGVASSARDSCNRGFYTVVVKDCVSSFNQKMHEMTLDILKTICLIEPSQNIIKEWE
jgi:nicotinamidase-related amidase